MSLVAAKDFLKFKEAIRRVYPEFTTTRDALTDRRDRQSMWFDNIQDLSLSSDIHLLLLASYQVAVQQFVVLRAFNDVRYVSAIDYLYQVLFRDDNCPFHAEFARRARL